MVQERFKKFKAHGLSNTRLYRIWYGMKQRCYNTCKKQHHQQSERGRR